MYRWLNCVRLKKNRQKENERLREGEYEMWLCRDAGSQVFYVAPGLLESSLLGPVNQLRESIHPWIDQ